MILHGYSTPREHDVFFSTNYQYNLHQLLWYDPLVKEHLLYFQGSYKGVQENSYSLPLSVFHYMQRKYPLILHQQESWLILGTAQARNWRPALLHYADGHTKDLGMFIEVTEEEARAEIAWTHDPQRGLWWICKEDPPTSLGDKQERILKAKAAAYDAIAEKYAKDFPTRGRMPIETIAKDVVNILNRFFLS